MDKKELDKQYKNLRKKISKLYSGYTPIREIEHLNRMLEMAYQNDLKRIEGR